MEEVAYNSKSNHNDRITEMTNIVSRGDVEKTWGIKTNEKDRYFFSKNYQKDIGNYIANDYYIIYLSGISIFDQIKTMNPRGYKFTFGSLNEKTIQDFGEPGYYLIKIRRRNLSFISDHKKLMPCPDGWRRANLREACEIMFNILFVDQKKIYQRDWHICPDRESKNRVMRIRFSILNPQEIIMENISTNKMSMNLNSITIKRL